VTSALWHNSGGGWQLLRPVRFDDESAPHDLVEEAPELLPLSGSPRLTIVGREVALGAGYADLVAVEPEGRLVLVELKLARNADARRAVVAQILSYAAALHGLTIDELEHEVLAAHRRRLPTEKSYMHAAGDDATHRWWP